MRLIVLAISVACGLLPCMLSVAEATTKEGAAEDKALLAIEPAQLSFGTVLDGNVAEKSIALKNLGVKPLTIAHVRASCTCLETHSTQDHILPGETITLRVLIKANGNAGKFDGNIWIALQDPPEIKTVSVSAEFAAVLSVDTDILIFKGMAVGREEERNIRIRSSVNATITVGLGPYDMTKGRVTVEEIPATAAGERQIKLRIRPSAIGKWSGVINVGAETATGDKAVRIVNYIVEANGPVIVNPDSLWFLSSETVKKVVVKGDPAVAGRFTIAKLDYDASLLDISSSLIDGEGGYELVIKPVGRWEKTTNLDVKIHITDGDAGMPLTLTFSVYLLGRSGAASAKEVQGPP